MSIESAMSSWEAFPHTSFDPYAEAQPVCICEECGEPVYDGEKIYTDCQTGVVIGCEHCIDYRIA